MPKIIDTVRFFEWGKPAPKNSRFKGTMNAKMIFGSNGYMDYTRRKDAVEENVRDQLTFFDDGFLGYTSREEASTGATVSSLGVLTAEKRKELRRQGTEAFSKPGDLIWDMVISLESYDEAHKNLLYHAADYAAVIEKILPQFFKKVGFDPKNMLWWMDYHNNKQHPHMHVIFMEKVHTRDRGAFTEKQMKSLKQIIAKEMTVRQTIRDLTGNDYETQFNLKDQEKAEIMEVLHEVDMSKIDSIQALAGILPKIGRLQYGSSAMIPYRDTIDRITDDLLKTDRLSPLYEEYLKALEPLDQAMKNDAGDSTIKTTELKKLYKEIGNIILQEIKQFSNQRPFKATVSKEELISWMGDEEAAELDGLTDSRAEEYRMTVERHKELLNGRRSPNQADLKEIYKRYEDLLVSNERGLIAGSIQHRMAQMEFYGEGVPRNLNLAKMHCMKAMTEGSNHSYGLMAKICFARQEISAGMNSLYNGCLHDDAVSEYLLAIEMLRGKKIDKDRDTGYQYMVSAAMRGFSPAIDYLREHHPRGFNESMQGRLNNTVWGHFRSRSVGNEVSGYLHNDDRIHHLQDRIETEIEAYLNNQKTPARRVR